MSRDLSRYRRIVVKIGSALLVDAATASLRRDWLEALADDIAALKATGADVLVVSSGAIALGRGVLGLPPRPPRLEESQAAAAVGQIALAHAWSEVLGGRGLTTGQVLLTLGDTEERRHYLNARSTLATLFGFGAVPVVNENDTVATSEIRYGDNDRLAARVASMASADCLILLSDVDGLYTAPPADDPAATLIGEVTAITPEIEAMAGSAGSELSRGGMRTKIDAAKIALHAGTDMVIAGGKRLNPIRAIGEGAPCTWFLAGTNPVTARKKWISGHVDLRGSVTVDDGAVRALRSGKSLLPAGAIAVEGGFSRGDAVAILSPDGHEIGRGLIAYDADDARALLGRRSTEIEDLLGYAGRAEMIHRDDMLLHGPVGEPAAGGL